MPPYPLAFAPVLAKERVSVGREAILTRGCDAQYSQAPQLLPELLSREQSGRVSRWQLVIGGPDNKIKSFKERNYTLRQAPVSRRWGAPFWAPVQHSTAPEAATPTLSLELTLRFLNSLL